MAKKKKKKKRSIVFKEITFKLTTRQKKSLEAYCKERKIGLIRMIKKSIVNYLNRPDDAVNTLDYVSPNQLDLFIEAELAAEDSVQYKKASV